MRYVLISLVLLICLLFASCGAAYPLQEEDLLAALEKHGGGLEFVQTDLATESQTRFLLQEPPLNYTVSSVDLAPGQLLSVSVYLGSGAGAEAEAEMARRGGEILAGLFDLIGLLYSDAGLAAQAAADFSAFLQTRAGDDAASQRWRANLGGCHFRLQLTNWPRPGYQRGDDAGMAYAQLLLVEEKAYDSWAAEAMASRYQLMETDVAGLTALLATPDTLLATLFPPSGDVAFVVKGTLAEIAPLQAADFGVAPESVLWSRLEGYSQAVLTDATGSLDVLLWPVPGNDADLTEERAHYLTVFPDPDHPLPIIRESLPPDSAAGGEKTTIPQL